MNKFKRNENNKWEKLINKFYLEIKEKQKKSKTVKLRNSTKKNQGKEAMLMIGWDV